MNRRNLARCLGLLLLIAGTALEAKECDQSRYEGEPYQLMLEEFALGNCLRHEADQTALGMRVNGHLDDADIEAVVSAVRAILAIEDHLAQNFTDPANEQSSNAQALGKALSKLRETIEKNPQTPIPGLASDWQLDSFERMPVALSGIDLIDSPSLLECPDVARQNCAAEFDRATDIVRAIHLANAAIDAYTRKYRVETWQARQLRRASWDSYYDDLTFQYPWELLANNWLLEKYDDRKTVDGNKQGFRPLPRSKLVFFTSRGEPGLRR